MDTNINNTITKKSSELSDVISERRKGFDINLNDLSYYSELIKTQKIISDFTDKLLQQMVILASGGHRVILEIFDEEELNDFLWDELDRTNNKSLSDLHQIYENVMLTFNGFASKLKQSTCIQNKTIDEIVENM